MGLDRRDRVVQLRPRAEDFARERPYVPRSLTRRGAVLTISSATPEMRRPAPRRSCTDALVDCLADRRAARTDATSAYPP
jgi:hypothetical protein